MPRNLTIYRSKVVSPDTAEYLNISVTCTTPGVELDSQAVKFSFDRAIWHTADWTGDVGATRTAQLLMTDANLPSDGVHTVFTRVTDNPEAPIINAGTVTVK